MEEKEEKTVNNVLGNLSNIMRVAKAMKVISELPIENFGLFKIDTTKPPPFYDKDELEHLVDAALRVDMRVGAAILLGGKGLRSGEKSGRGREVPMTDRLRFVLKSLGRVKGERLLVKNDGTPYSPKQLRTLVKKAQFEAGL